MPVRLAPIFQDAQLDSSGNPSTGAKLFTYAAGSSTKLTAYQDSAGTVAHTNAIVLNSRGEPPAPIWLQEVAYKFVLAPSTDTDPPASPIRTIDNVVGINDVAATAVSEWAASSAAPTYISATGFSLVGDQTTDFHVGRRIKCTVTAGTVYATIGASAYTSLTTVSVQLDTGSLDAGLSAVALGINSAANRSAPLPDTAMLSWGGPLAPHENLGITRPSAATLTITADKLVAANTNGRKAVLSSVNVTVNMASAGANGLDTGAEAASTWYHAWVIWNGTTVSGLFSLSATAPTLPSGYTHKAYCGADYNNSSSNLLEIEQRGGRVKRGVLALLTAGVATSLTQITVTAAVPSTARVINMEGQVKEVTATGTSINTDIAPSNSTTFQGLAFWARGQSADLKGSGGTVRMVFMASAQALWYLVNASTTDATFVAIGWEY